MGENAMLRKAFLWTTILFVVALLFSGIAAAQEVKNVPDIGDVQPPNFRLGGEDGICSGNVLPIPDNTPDAGVTDTINVSGPCGPIGDLEVLVQISHTWVGDLEVMLTSPAGTSAVVLDRPGLQPPAPPPGSCCGCSSNDIDATFTDAGLANAESMCNGSPPAISGDVVGGDPANNTLMAAFAGEELCGDWQLRVTDGAGADTGQLNDWCLLGAGPGDGEPPVPASSRTGIIALVALLLLGSTFYMIRRRQTV